MENLDLDTLLTPDVGNPIWWAAVAAALVAAAQLWDRSAPSVALFVEGTANKLDDRLFAALRPWGIALRAGASAIRFLLPLAAFRASLNAGNAAPDIGDNARADIDGEGGEDERGEAGL